MANPKRDVYWLTKNVERERERLLEVEKSLGEDTVGEDARVVIQEKLRVNARWKSLTKTNNKNELNHISLLSADLIEQVN